MKSWEEMQLEEGKVPAPARAQEEITMNKQTPAALCAAIVNGGACAACAAATRYRREGWQEESSTLLGIVQYTLPARLRDWKDECAAYNRDQTRLYFDRTFGDGKATPKKKHPGQLCFYWKSDLAEAGRLAAFWMGELPGGESPAVVMCRAARARNKEAFGY